MSEFLYFAVVGLFAFVFVFGMIVQDKHAREERKRMMSAVEEYRRHKTVDKDVVNTLHRYMIICKIRVEHTCDIDDEKEYQQAQKDYNNARAYYLKFGG